MKAGETMSEKLKKASRKLRGIPEPRLMGPEEVYTIEDWKKLKVNVRVAYEGLPLEKHSPICPYCGKVSPKDVKQALFLHNISRRIFEVDKCGRQNKLLIELYEKMKNKKVNATEAFAEESRIYQAHRIFKRKGDKDVEGRPTTSTSGQVAIKCAECNYPLGSITVKAVATPAHPERPDVDVWIGLPKTAKEMRLVRETFHLGELSLDGWLIGEDRKPFVEMLEAFRDELGNVRFVRETARSVRNLKSALHLAIKEVRREIETRKGRLFNLLAGR